ncbi:hypothetical protein [Persicirhabdus sediminis]|uniref:hypothetical protein n=1 Tax=Persicirhabdus sediminis TaxID=454144 RepID=UPI001F2742EB|nr:hypothetical protein [Persicirhabdus sediminis]
MHLSVMGFMGLPVKKCRAYFCGKGIFVARTAQEKPENESGFREIIVILMGFMGLPVKKCRAFFCAGLTN